MRLTACARLFPFDNLEPRQARVVETEEHDFVDVAKEAVEHAPDLLGRAQMREAVLQNQRTEVSHLDALLCAQVHVDAEGHYLGICLCRIELVRGRNRNGKVVDGVDRCVREYLVHVRQRPRHCTFGGKVAAAAGGSAVVLITRITTA